MIDEKIIKTLKKGFIEFTFSDVINKIFMFSSGIIIVRILSKSEYGSLMYAFNILNFFLWINGFGVSNGVLQFCSSVKNRDERISYFKYSLKLGVIINLFISSAIFLTAILYNLPIKGSSNILRNFSFLPPLLTIYCIFQSYLRALFENKKYVVLNIIYSITFLIFVFLLGIFYKINGIIFSRYISLIIPVIIGIFYLKKDILNITKAAFLEIKKRLEFLKFSFFTSFSTVIGQILYIIDIFLIGFILKNEDVIASYKTATIIPFSLNFLPASIISFFYPYFVRNKDNKEWIKMNYFRIQFYLLLLNVFITVILYLFAPLIINLFFGSKYLDGLNIFRVLSIGYLIAGTFRIPAGNILNSINKTDFNLYISLVMFFLNIILDIIFIIKFNAIGAAIATVIIFALSAIVSNIYIYLL